MTKAPYLNCHNISDLFDRVEPGVTGDVVWVNACRFERVIVKGFEKQTLWVETHIGADGEPTGDWDALSQADAVALNLI